MTEQTITQPTVTLELTERQALYLRGLLIEEGRGLPRRPAALVQIERKLDDAIEEHALDNLIEHGVV